MPSSAKHSRGFTLLEVLIAIGILSMSLTSLLSSQMASMRATRYAQGVTAAAFLAEHQLLEIEGILPQQNRFADIQDDVFGTLSVFIVVTFTHPDNTGIGFDFH